MKGAPRSSHEEEMEPSRCLRYQYRRSGITATRVACGSSIRQKTSSSAARNEVSNRRWCLFKKSFLYNLFQTTTSVRIQRAFRWNELDFTFSSTPAAGDRLHFSSNSPSWSEKPV